MASHHIKVIFTILMLVDINQVLTFDAQMKIILPVETSLKHVWLIKGSTIHRKKNIFHKILNTKFLIFQRLQKAKSKCNVCI